MRNPAMIANEIAIAHCLGVAEEQAIESGIWAAITAARNEALEEAALKISEWDDPNADFQELWATCQDERAARISTARQLAVVVRALKTGENGNG